MILACHMGLFWSANFFVDEKTLSFTTSYTPIPQPIFSQKILVDDLVGKATQKYVVSSNPEISAPATFEQALNKTAIPNPFIWIGDKRIYTPEGTQELKIVETDYFNYFFLEPNSQQAENAWQNRLLYGPKTPCNPYDISLENAVSFSKIKFAINNAYLKVISGADKIIISGSYPFFYGGVSRLMLAVLNSFNLPGVWRIAFDEKDSLSCLATLSFYDKSLAEAFLLKNPFNTTVTALVVPNATEGEIDFGLGKNQSFDFKNAGVFFVPIAEKDLVKVILKIKGKKRLTFEVGGGSYGLVIDARPRPLTGFMSKSYTLKETEQLKRVLETKVI
ncbi:hypothetical protein L6255_01125 [Candidatus Parcubacteria bacterium]|nr:hypothetical protein [Patescibacteria group bacterium]MCG2689020.1 hypothetical protein [Candidatus Parcubacteria bacterium]